MRVRLRWKILILAVLAPMVLGLATLDLVNRRVSAHIRATVDDNLTRSALVCEQVLRARARALESSARVVTQDPRFLSVLALAASSRDRQVTATVEDVARDFGRIARADLFEVFDARGRRLASVGRDASDATQRGALLTRTEADGAATAVLAGRAGLMQVAAVRALSGGRVVGTLLIGLRLGDRLAAELGTLTRSQVRFPSGAGVPGGTSVATVGPSLPGRAPAPEPPPAGRAASGQVAEVVVDGKRTLTLARPVPGAGAETPALYVLQRSLDQEMAFLGGVQRELVGLGALILLAAIAIGLMVAIAITRPVRELVRAAEEMERGNYDSPLEVRSRDEIGYLARRFQEMRRHERDYVNGLEDVARLKSDFITVASHEMRTPVTLIKAYGELFADGSLGPATDMQRDAIDVIQRSIKALIRITDDAASMADVQGERPVLHREESGLEAVVREAVMTATSDAPQRHVPVSLDLAPDLGRMRVDATRLGQAIAHLVRNAIRFTPDDGAITVAARRDGAELVVEVRDTGIGIPEEKKGHLFTRSFLVRDPLNHHSSGMLEFNSAGLGLGLPIAHGIVRAHGGSISVASRPGAGSTFTIRIPDAPVPSTIEAA